MRARVVPPAAAPAAAPGAPADLAEELRRAAAAAAGGALEPEALEELACVACDAAEGPGPRRGRLAEALAPLLAPLPGAGAEVLEALLAALGPEEEEGPGAEGGGAGLRLRAPPAAPARPQARAGGGWLRRVDVESARAAEYLRERARVLAREQEREVAREQELAALYGPAPAAAAADCGAVAVAGGPGEPMDGAAGDGESSDEDDTVTLRDREATKRRLRQLGEPVTFFGENDARRTARLVQCELCRDQDVLAGGSTNVMQIIDRRAERDKVVERDDEDDYGPSREETTTKADSSAADNGRDPAVTEEQEGGQTIQSKSMGMLEAGGTMFSIAERGDDDDAAESLDADARIVVRWLRTTLREWEAALLARTPAETGAAAFKAEKARFRQSKQYLKPLRRSLRDGDIQPAIVASLAKIAVCCERWQYREAKEAYMQLAIGNKPWPMGVTKVTFHDRPNRHIIGEDSIAHVLDDETTRKYVQMVKRLLSFWEGRWPVDPSRAA